MNRFVEMHEEGEWIRADGESAIIISNITSFRIFPRTISKRPAIGFPNVEGAKEYVFNKLSNREINFTYNDKVMKDFGKENKYKKFLHEPRSYSRKVIGKYYTTKGDFIVQYDDEEPEKYVIGENINKDAELVKCVRDSEAGDVITINDYNILVIDQNIRDDIDFIY